ncbi:MAG TPA: DinB family protein [Planctomycetota bacterium]|nr:DinB family protein [Planctomycetota bacterium]
MPDPATLEPILQAWRTNQRINLHLLQHITPEGLRDTLSTRGGRSVARQFAHLHNVRIMHLEARAKALLPGSHKFATEDEPNRATLVAALEDSAGRIEEMFTRAAEGVKGIRLPKRGAVQFLAYFVAHESHHRGNILLTLKQCGHAVPQEERYAIWDWDRI